MSATVLLGELARHARGQTLARSFGAAAEGLPDAGVAFAFGKQFQEDEVLARSALTWIDHPGRAVVLVPPFAKGSTPTPAEWEARRCETMAGGDGPLVASLAAERSYELRGNLVPAVRVGAQSVTAVWRRHPAAGALVVTALPLWSLRALEHPAECAAWLRSVVELAGEPRGPASGEAPSPTTEPTTEQWPLLLFLCTGPYPNGVAALDAFDASTTFTHLERSVAASMLDVLRRSGWVEGGALTPAGARLLDRSPLAAYARDLRKKRHV